jgi:hypothetical protein
VDRRGFAAEPNASTVHLPTAVKALLKHYTASVIQVLLSNIKIGRRTLAPNCCREHCVIAAAVHGRK